MVVQKGKGSCVSFMLSGLSPSMEKILLVMPTHMAL